jgi:putative ABC transport system ATP-binding protein
LTVGVGLLLISSSISLSVPFTIGRLIDYFSSSSQNLTLSLPPAMVDYLSLPAQLELTPAFAGGILLSLFTLGAISNAGRSFLFRLSGQKIVQRLRQRTYDRALRQEVEFVEKGEGDIVSRLSVDSTIVGEA